MAKTQPKNQYLPIDKRDGQVSAQGGELANYFFKNIPLITLPAWQEAEFWRKFVRKQQIAEICRDRIASYLNSLDWQIVPRDSEDRDELRGKIKYYTKLLEKGSSYYNDIDFSSHIEWIVKDLFDLPFGAASEIGRLDDNPRGRVVWVRPLDAGSLAPTLNFEYPVVQQAITSGLTPVYLPKDFVARVYLNPRTELRREGWGFAPPERIYLSIEMLSRGDNYYAQLLLNTPEAGIIDLGDMEKSSAIEWVKSLRDLLYGVNPFKIPVLYEHTTDAKWIPFGKPPSEILYDSTTLKYAAILAAGYGLTLSDIGISMSSSGGGDTLAGTIRMERVSKSSGFGTAKKKIAAYFNKILPDSLKFTWIDYDDEKNVAKGRARLASAQASDIFVRNRVFKPSEVRQQMLADGLISITVPETVDPNDPEFQAIQPAFGKLNFGGSKPQSMGNPQAPSSGGQGEILPQQVVQRNLARMEVGISKAVYEINKVLSVLLKNVSQKLSQAEMDIWDEYVDSYLTGKSDIEEPELKSVLDGIYAKGIAKIKDQPWVAEFSKSITDRILRDAQSELLSKLSFAEEEGAEKEIPQDLDSIYRSELDVLINHTLVNTLARYALLISKSVILDGNLDVDATEQVDNNIRVSRKISKEIIGNLSSLVNSAYTVGREYLNVKTGEQDAVS